MAKRKTKTKTLIHVKAPKSELVIMSFDNKTALNRWLEKRPMRLDLRIFEVKVTEKPLVIDQTTYSVA